MNDKLKIITGPLVVIPLYILIGAFTFGYAYNDNLRRQQALSSIGSPTIDGFVSGMFWPIYWPGHWSRLFWQSDPDEQE